jgi:hypothetical protein
MPRVVACWESAFEEAGFTGEYVAVVSFTVRPDGDIADASVAEAHDLSGPEPTPLTNSNFERCLVDALNQTRLGMRPQDPLPVSGYRLAFADASADARRAALEREPNILVGPRADRCHGLFGHAPPRDAGPLQQLLGEAQAAAHNAADEPDKEARSLQLAYDLALELRARLRADARREMPRASKRRTIEELRRAEAVAEDIGERIGCRPPM